MIIDISGGPAATGYPVSIQYLLDVPATTGWTDEYKTTKIPMRWIRPGVFNREGYSGYPQINVNYWMGVFEITQRQYEMVVGSKPFAYQGFMRPAENCSFGDFIARLKNKTGRKYKTPTPTEWLYAFRAGTTSSCYDGTSSYNRKATFAESGSSEDLGRFSGNRNDGKGKFSEHANVGSYVPNAYGLYDMLGNVFELASGDYCYGGSWTSSSADINSREYSYGSYAIGNNKGLRLCCDAD